MIQIEWKDKNGRTLCEGDKYKIFQFGLCGWQEEGDFGGGFYTDSYANYKEYVFKMEIEEYCMLCLPWRPEVTEREVYEIFEFTGREPKEELEECVWAQIREGLGVDENESIESMLKLMIGFIIID